MDGTTQPGPIIRRGRALTVAAAAALALAISPASASAAPQMLSFAPEADTYVNAAGPTGTHGKSTGMEADASPQKQSFIRFRVNGLAGQQVTGVKLRLHQNDASRLGGRVFSMSSTTWSESVSWDARPAIDGPLLGSFGAVAAGNAYELELGASAVRDGVVSYAIDSTSSDGVRWATRESATPPRLLVTVDDPPSTIFDGLSQVAAANIGSSEPTSFATNHRLAMTAGGRLLAIHGRHQSGVQLAWRDPAGTWQTRSTGASASGAVLSGTGTGDWPASIAVARDAAGSQHGWIVWSGTNVGGLRPVQMRRITDLDSPDGPRLGPVVTVDPAPRGAYKADIGFERAPDGTMRGCILYSRRVGDSAYELSAVWFTDLTSEAPALTDRVTLETSASSAHYGSLVPSIAGLRAVTRAGGTGGSLRLYGHYPSSSLTTWFTGATGPAIPSGSTPTGVALASGEILAVTENDLTNHVSIAYRFSASGTTGATDLLLTGLAQPSVASDGAGAWVVGVRQSDGLIVSRSYSPDTGWSASFRLEIGPEAGGPLAWPNALRDADGRLRLVAEGPGASSTTSSVWAFQRPL